MKSTTLLPSSPLVLLALSLALLPAAASANDCTVLDTLQGISTDTRFSVFGSGGRVISTSQSTGPMFTLDETTTITEIGGFVNNCKSIIAGVPGCPDTSPFVVQIRPAIGDIPDPDRVLGTFTLSHDDDPLTVSFESAPVSLTLEPGDYFAMFAPGDPEDVGFLLHNASIPFRFTASDVLLGFLDLETGRSFNGLLGAGVRIMGHCTLEVGLDIKPGSFPNVINPRSRGVIPVAVLTTAGFDATLIDPEALAFGPAGAEPAHAVFKDVNADGKTDLLLHFRTQDTGITCATTSASLTGRTTDGRSIEGTDSVRTTGCK